MGTLESNFLDLNPSSASQLCDLKQDVCLSGLHSLNHKMGKIIVPIPHKGILRIKEIKPREVVVGTM